MNENMESVVAGAGIAGIGLMIKKVVIYLKTSQLELFWNKIDKKILKALEPIVKTMEDMDKRLHETKKTQEAVQLETLKTLEEINRHLKKNAE